MLYPVMTQVSSALESRGKARSSAGKATFTIDRSSEAMNAPRAVTRNTTPRRLGCVIGRILSHCIP